MKRKVVGAEALCRWYDDEFGWISPLDFIAIAETRGLMQSLGDWVLKEACRQLVAWNTAGHPLPGRLAVNISNKQLESNDVVERFQSHHRKRSQEKPAVGTYRNRNDAGARVKLQAHSVNFTTSAFIGQLMTSEQATRHFPI